MRCFLEIKFADIRLISLEHVTYVVTQQCAIAGQFVMFNSVHFIVQRRIFIRHLTVIIKICKEQRHKTEAQNRGAKQRRKTEAQNRGAKQRRKTEAQNRGTKQRHKTEPQTPAVRSGSGSSFGLSTKRTLVRILCCGVRTLGKFLKFTQLYK